MDVNRKPVEIVYRKGKERISVMAIGSKGGSYSSRGSFVYLTLVDGTEIEVNEKGMSKATRKLCSALYGRKWLYKIADSPEIILTPWDENWHDGNGSYEVSGLPKDTVQLWSVNVFTEHPLKKGEFYWRDLDDDKVWLIQAKSGVYLHVMNNDEIFVKGENFHAVLAELFCGQKLIVRTYKTTVETLDAHVTTNTQTIE